MFLTCGLFWFYWFTYFAWCVIVVGWVVRLLICGVLGIGIVAIGLFTVL